MTTTTLREKFGRLGFGDLYSEEDFRSFEEDIAAVERLKREKNAVVLAHSYQRPEIFEIADFTGDSLELSRAAQNVSADVIVFCGVHFMAETAKMLNPSRTVLLPNLAAGCSLAESVDPAALTARIAELRRTRPDLAVVSYINTTAAVKALSDVCVTSSNAVEIVNRMPNETILFLPDRNLGAYVRKNTKKEVILWDGNCYVHEELQPSEILSVKKDFPGAKVLVHPECRTDVLDLADAVLSTSGMIKYAKESPATEFIIVTECGLSDRLAMEVPEKRFYKSCNLCKFMKMITLPDTRLSLERLAPEITLAPGIAERARRPIERMLELSSV